MTPEGYQRTFQPNLLLWSVLSESTGLETRLVSLTAGRHVLASAREADDVYFPLDCVISLVVDFKDGRWAEVLGIGRDGALGLFEPRDRMPGHGAVVTIGGRAAVLSLRELQGLTTKSNRVRDLVQSHINYCFGAGLQRAACFAIHRPDERLATWLLLTERRVGAEIEITHDRLADVLALRRRATASLLLESFAERGILGLRRGRVLVLDAAALREIACECLSNLSRFPDDQVSPSGPAPRR